ncbi:MAG TPA: asparagine synthase (glutamine-hydrolyzing) [Steroidobacteraceae bacterium]|nr:asparagine synthase (glutamine-hydrolyzing) [Steroidobacteraceae bacterium]
MCGIAGAIAVVQSQVSPSELKGAVQRMALSLTHRGPDAAGIWLSDDASVVLAHRRLAIVDLSERGRQPMSYAGGRYQITFNGEIYNFRELVTELEKAGCTFHSDSDTEVLLAAIANWGIDKALTRLVGMFAFAVWDNQTKCLHLARDRMGEKPLHVGRIGSHVYFASELRAFRHVPGYSSRVSPVAMGAYLQRGYVPEALSMYSGVMKLPPGSAMTIRSFSDARLAASDRGWHAEESPGYVAPRRYWFLEQVASAAKPQMIVNPVQASAEFESILRDSVRKQMACDVPFGAFLSGGIDSSLVTAVMQAESSTPVHTFTVAFDKPEFDESVHAAAISRHLGTRHEQFTLSDVDVLRCVPETIRWLDEPTANGSFFPVYLISRFARQHVTVVLSGDAGDELFSGYNRYVGTAKVWERLRHVPLGLRRIIARSLRKKNFRSLDSNRIVKSLLARGSQIAAGTAAMKLARLLPAVDLRDCYARAVACWPSVSLCDEQITLPERPWSDALQPMEARMWLADQLDYLPGDNLAKVDRASMAVSLETRLPLLDHRLVEFSWRVSPELKRRDGRSKWLMRQLLEKFVPRPMFERQKMGFSVPVDAWLTGPLKEWASGMLQATNFLEDLPFREGAVREHWDLYQARGNPSAYEAWALVMLAAWIFESKRDQSVVAAALD